MGRAKKPRCRASWGKAVHAMGIEDIAGANEAGEEDEQATTRKEKTMSQDTDPQMTIANGTDVLCFLSQFDFWDLSRSSNGKFSAVVRHERTYVKVWSRQNETLIEMVDRLRIKVESS